MVAAAAVAALVAASPGRSDDIPWDRIHDAAGLDGAQRGVVEKVIRTAACYGGCEGTILDCLRKGDPFAIRLANFVARRAAAKRPADDVLTSVADRKLSAYPPKTFDIDVSELVPSGHRDAPVEVVIWADFDCPFCKVAATALRELSLAMPDSFSLWFKNYPLAQDDRATPAALAYLAAERQGKGWEMYDVLFTHDGELTDSALTACALEAGVDTARYRADVRDPSLLARVRAEKAAGVACGFHKVPGVLIDGKPFLGIKTKVELKDRIEEELDLVAHKP
jgi:protein-disulfide isomerase